MKHNRSPLAGTRDTDMHALFQPGGIEHRTSNPGAAGSSPAGRARNSLIDHNRSEWGRLAWSMKSGWSMERPTWPANTTVIELSAWYCEEIAVTRVKWHDAPRHHHKWLTKNCPLLGTVGQGAALGDYELRDVDARVLSLWHGWLQGQVCGSTANKILSHASNVLRLAMSQGLLSGTNPALSVRRAKYRRRRAMPRALLPKILDAIDLAEEQRVKRARRFSDPRRACLARCATVALRLLLLTGARCNEVLTARRQDVQLDGPRPAIHRETSKTGTPRHILLAGPCLDIVRVHMQRLDEAGIRSPWLFPARPKNNAAPCIGHQKKVRKAWSRVSKLAGVEGRTVAELRNAWMAQALEAGASYGSIAAAMGHMSDRMVREVYAWEIAPDFADQAANAFLGGLAARRGAA